VTRYRPFRKKRSFALAATLIVLVVLASSLAFNGLPLARAAAMAVIYPFQFAADQVWRAAAGLPGAVSNLQNLAAENARLDERLNAALARLTVLDELQTENDRLRAELGFQKRGGFGRRLLAARVVGKSGSPWLSILEIDRGAGAGVKSDMPVVAPDGLVGRVTEVAPQSAKVLLVSDPLSAVAAADQRSRDFGVIEGTAPGALRLKYVGVGSDVQVGDRIVTAAISSVFPAGIPVGTVSQASKKEVDLFYEITVKPAVDFSKLEEVFLVF
jgi:rod shape-determining protein MreC